MVNHFFCDIAHHVVISMFHPNVLVSRTGPLTYEFKTVAFPVSAGLGGVRPAWA